VNVTEQKYRMICDLLSATYPILAPTWQSAYDRFGDEWLEQFIVNIETIFGPIKKGENQAGLMDAINGYAEFCNDSLRSQSFFERNGRYKASSYAECVDNFYHNEDHMTRCYLPGMWISHYIWPQHYNMLVGFQTGALRRVQRATNLFFEVGVGCGMYSKIVMDQLPNARGVGFDISQHSLNFTKKMADLFGHGDRYRIENRDIREGYSEKCDFLVCQEVLEHLENPAEFCRWLHDLIRPNGYAYITAALNAAHSDHIYLIRDPLELESMLRAAGFTPLGLQEEFAAGQKPRHITPSLAGYLCQRM
jgi:SAM-dependent methyltransferase